MPFCKYFQSGICNFSDEDCWYIHKKNDKAMKTFKCGYCGKHCNSKNEFMIHRKTEHSSVVKACLNYANGTCEFKDKCWYYHNEESENVSSFSDF